MAARGRKDLTSCTRRAVLLGLAGAALPGCALPRVAAHAPASELDDYRTPYKHPDLVLAGVGVPGAFDELAGDIPFVFTHENAFYMSYVGFDGEGYQTGLARSEDLVGWRRIGLILGGDESDPYTRHNIALTSILRENALYSPGRLSTPW